MRYLIGDVQGCCGALQRLLDTLDFSPSRDHVVVLGDLVNRGPDSLGTLRLLRGLGDSATCLLGNHDLHLLAVAIGGQRLHRSDTLGDILASPERDALLDWLRHGKLADMAHGWHPNFPAAYEPCHHALVNAGPVIKSNANQRYSTSAETAARLPPASTPPTNNCVPTAASWACPCTPPTTAPRSKTCWSCSRPSRWC